MEGRSSLFNGRRKKNASTNMKSALCVTETFECKLYYPEQSCDYSTLLFSILCAPSTPASWVLPPAGSHQTKGPARGIWEPWKKRRGWMGGCRGDRVRNRGLKTSGKWWQKRGLIRDFRVVESRLNKKGGKKTEFSPWGLQASSSLTLTIFPILHHPQTCCKSCLLN